jgi:hypothetical protein
MSKSEEPSMKLLNIVWSAVLIFSLQASPQAAGPVQPDPNVGAGANTPASSGTSQPAADDLFKASNVREVATIGCTTGSGETCMDKTKVQAVQDHFNGTLVGSDGKDSSEFSVAIKDFLKSVGFWPGTANYAIIHLVVYGGDNDKPPTRQKWILAKRSKGSVELSDSLHILGAHNISLIFLHMNATVAVPSGVEPTRADILKKYDDISYRGIVAPKLPINVQHLLDLLKIATGNLQADVTTKFVSFAGYGIMTRVDVPSDVTVFGAHVASKTLIGQSQKYDNEGKYWWDASVAVPVNKLSQLDYSTDNGTYTPKTINKQSIYALINLYPDLVDLKYGAKRWLIPRAVAGIGLTGRPGENFLVGGAWGIQQLQFFVGTGFANHQVLTPGADPKLGTSFTQKYGSHLTYGINVPVASVITKMAAAAKANASAGTTGKSGATGKAGSN